MVAQNRQLTYAAVVLAAFGAIALIIWAFINDGSATSMLLLLSGIGVIVLAVLLYFFSPSRYLMADVGGAMAISDVLSLNAALSSLLVTSRGIHVPSAQAGSPKLYMPLSGDITPEQLASLKPGSAVFDVSGDIKGITLSPPGRGLLVYAQSIGASFSAEGLENEVKDVMENGLELADKVNVHHEGGKVSVRMDGLSVAQMCIAIRKEDAGICSRTGCPVCSFVACMIAEGTGSKVRVESLKNEGGAIIVTYELI